MGRVTSPAGKPRGKPPGSSGDRHRMGLLAAASGPYGKPYSSDEHHLEGLGQPGSDRSMELGLVVVGHLSSSS
jgi:hypothetical protein